MNLRELTQLVKIEITTICGGPRLREQAKALAEIADHLADVRAKLQQDIEDKED